jgi:hypothetical protein
MLPIFEHSILQSLFYFAHCNVLIDAHVEIRAVREKEITARSSPGLHARKVLAYSASRLVRFVLT